MLTNPLTKGVERGRGLEAWLTSRWYLDEPCGLHSPAAGKVQRHSHRHPALLEPEMSSRPSMRSRDERPAAYLVDVNTFRRAGRSVVSLINGLDPGVQAPHAG